MYKTKQKDIILNAIKKEKKEFTIKDIYSKVKNDVGLTTVYRLIDSLVNENIITKGISQDNVTYYQYLEECNCNNHFYLKCNKCGNLEHVNCDCINELTEHIKNEHKFNLNHDHIIINGTCKKCGGK